MRNIYFFLGYTRNYKYFLVSWEDIEVIGDYFVLQSLDS